MYVDNLYISYLLSQSGSVERLSNYIISFREQLIINLQLFPGSTEIITLFYSACANLCLYDICITSLCRIDAPLTINTSRGVLCIKWNLINNLKFSSTKLTELG